ncbi:MAG: NTPase [Methanotrichaceae archaeon]|nr:NTPase [Methanotrichaceae archaeon]
MLPRIAVTGPPGVGKSTVVHKVIELCKSRVRIGGVLTRDKRLKGKRIGFEIMDIASGATGQLSDLWGKGPRVGQYRVNLVDLDNIGTPALENALNCDLIVVDEVGPMELQSNKFIQAVENVIASEKSILVVVKLGYNHPLALNIRRIFKIITVTRENRESLPSEIAKELCMVMEPLNK